MDKKNFITFIDIGSHSIKTGSYNNQSGKVENKIEFNFSKKNLYESNKFIEQIIFEIEKKNGEYLNEIYLMMDDFNTLNVNISNFKIKESNSTEQEFINKIKDEAKLQIINNYPEYELIHLITKNFIIDEKKFSKIPEKLYSKKIGLDLAFILHPKTILKNLKEIFASQNITIKKFLLSSYAKSLFYLNQFSDFKKIIFVDIGYEKTITFCFENKKFHNLKVLPIGGNHVTKDISKILKIDEIKSENLKLNLNKLNLSNEFNKDEIELIKKIIISRTEELLEKSTELDEVKYNSLDLQLVFFGNGSKILDNKFNSRIAFNKNINLVEENYNETFISALNLVKLESSSQIGYAAKAEFNKGFFEKFFNLFD